MALSFLSSYNDKYGRLFPGGTEGKRASRPCLVLNEHAGQFCKVKCKAMRQLRTEDQLTPFELGDTNFGDTNSGGYKMSP